MTQGYSSAGRVPVSKTVGRGFESSCPCQTKEHQAIGLVFFCFVCGLVERTRHRKAVHGCNVCEANLPRSEAKHGILLPLP